MSENLDHLTQEQRDSLAGEIINKRRERDTARKQAFLERSQGLKGVLKNFFGLDKAKKLHRTADELHKDARTILEKAKKIESPKIEIIDEHYPGNLLSDTSRNLDLSIPLGQSPFSTEGFAENPERQSNLAQFLINKLGLKTRGPLLDVGFGANIHISNTFASQGIRACALDEQQFDRLTGESLWHAPKMVRKNDQGVEVFSGDVADLIKEGSQLANQQFGLILFNGSWSSGGNNWTVGGEVLESKYYNLANNKVSQTEFMDNERDEILRSCKERLTEKGLIGIVSSRYAFHGAGYSYDRLPEEKLDFIDVYARLTRLGAKKFYIFGVSQNGLDQMVARSSDQYPEEYKDFKLQADEISHVRRQLETVLNLPDEDVHSRHGDNPEFQRNLISAAKEVAKNVSEFGSIARIDAIFAEF